MPPAEQQQAFMPSAEQQPNFNPDAVLSEGPVPSPAELVTRPDLQPVASTTVTEGRTNPALAAKYLKEAVKLLDSSGGDEDDTDTREHHVKVVESIQIQFGKIRSQIEKHGEGPTHPEYVKAITTNSESLVKVLLSPEVQAKPEDTPLNRDGYELLAHHFNKGKIPTFDELVGLRNVITAKDPSALLEDPNLSDADKAKIQGYIDEVEEKSQAEYWMLSADQRHWYSRVAEIPSLKPYKEPIPAPRNGRQKVFDKAAPKGSSQRKAFYKYISPPRHPNPNPKASPAPHQSKYFSKDEILRVKRELWNNNPRQERNPHKNYNQNDKAVMAAAREESFARLQLDSSIRTAHDQFESEVQIEKAKATEAARYAVLAGQLGRLGVRDETDQLIFEVADEYVRSYNEKVLKRGTDKVVVAAGVKPVSSRTEQETKPTIAKVSFGQLQKPKD